MQTSYNSRANYSLPCVSSETHNLQRVFTRGLLPYIGYIGMCGAKGYVFEAVLVWNRVLISTIVVWNRVWFVPFSLQLGMSLEEATSSSFGDKTISLLTFTCRNSLSSAPVTRRLQGFRSEIGYQIFDQVWNRSYLSLLGCYKTIHGLNGPNCNDYFELNCYGKTRSNHSFKLRQPLARVNCFFVFFLHSFFVRIIKQWNALPKEIVHEQDFSIFRSKLRKYYEIL